jgi:hypothetical protein
MAAITARNVRYWNTRKEAELGRQALQPLRQHQQQHLRRGQALDAVDFNALRHGRPSRAIASAFVACSQCGGRNGLDHLFRFHESRPLDQHAAHRRAMRLPHSMPAALPSR